VLEIFPALADHATAVLLVFSTRAVNCWVPPDITVALAGVSVMRGAVFPVEVDEADCRPLPQAVKPVMAPSKRREANMRHEDQKFRFLQARSGFILNIGASQRKFGGTIAFEC
jgi:hypothetical protein